MNFQSILVEDSRLARNELKTLLQAHPEIEVVGEAANADEALFLLQEKEVDLLFLDIHLPGKNGFELLESLEHIPQVIFTTAYDQYAIKSFEYNALDYLLKPIKPERLAKAIEKAQQLLKEKSVVTNAQQLGEQSQVFVKDGEKCWIVKLKDIRLFEVSGNYTRIHFDTHRPIIARSMNYLESRLDPAVFFRANRQQMINLKWVENMEPWFKGRYKVRLRGGEEVEISRRQATKFRDLLSF